MLEVKKVDGGGICKIIFVSTVVEMGLDQE